MLVAANADTARIAHHACAFQSTEDHTHSSDDHKRCYWRVYRTSIAGMDSDGYDRAYEEGQSIVRHGCSFRMLFVALNLWYKLPAYREMELRGFSTPISASYKGAQQVGRAVEGNPDWIDLSRRNQNREDDERRRKEEEEEADENDTEERDDERGGDRDGGRDLPKATGGSDRTSGGNSGGQQPGPSNGNTGTGRKPPPPSKGAGKSDGKGRDSESKNTGTSKRKGKRDEGGPEDDYSDIND